MAASGIGLFDAIGLNHQVMTRRQLVVLKKRNVLKQADMRLQ